MNIIMNRYLVLSAAFVFLMAGVAPVALAKDPSHTPPSHEANDKEKGAHGKAKFHLELQGSGKGKDNRTYTITVTADGMGKAKSKDGNATKIMGKAKAHFVVKDANGTIVREGDGKLKIMAHKNGSENWTWHLETVGKKGKGMPRLNARGDATKTGEGTWSLEGKGKMVFKVGDDAKAIKVKLDPVTGTLTRT